MVHIKGIVKRTYNVYNVWFTLWLCELSLCFGCFFFLPSSYFTFDIKYEKFKFLLLFMKRERAKTYKYYTEVKRRCSEFFNFFMRSDVIFGQYG